MYQNQGSGAEETRSGNTGLGMTPTVRVLPAVATGLGGPFLGN